MSRLFNGYLRLLRDYTLPTQMATGGIIITLGDSLAQHGVERKPLAQHDFARSSRFLLYGSCMFAPMAYNWHRLLNRVKFDKVWKTGAARVAIDINVFGMFAVVFFFTCMGALEKRKWSDIKQRIEQSFWYIWTRGLGVFVPVQILNLTVMPVWARPPVLNLVSLGWSCFLATINQRRPVGRQEEMPLMPTVAKQQL